MKPDCADGAAGTPTPTPAPAASAMDGGGDALACLLSTSSSSQPTTQRTGNVWSAMAHIVTGVIGAGVLSMAWCIAQLGWIAGPSSLLLFALVTLFSSSLLSDCYSSLHPRLGMVKFSSLIPAVGFYLGEKRAQACRVVLMLNYYGCGVAYIITAALSIRAIRKSNCYHKEGHETQCTFGSTTYTIFFGLVQVFVSQIPDFHNMKWLSFSAAAMSISYSSIGIALSLGTVLENGRIRGTVGGTKAATDTEKTWAVFQALGDVAFAYPYTGILLEIQDTLRSPPAENETMKKASMASVSVTTFFYLCCGCFGYAAFGDVTPGNLLTGFGFYEPYWLIDFANACVVLHLFGGYQVFGQPVFAEAERWCTARFPGSRAVAKHYTVGKWRVSLLRVWFRTVYVGSTTTIAAIFPYFNQVVGLLGALSFWPLAVYFPVEMYIVKTRVRRWTAIWVSLQVFSLFCLCLSLAALLGSVQGLLNA